MQVQTTLLPSLPLRRNTRIDIRLVYDLWNQLRPVIDEIRAWRWDLRAVDGIAGAVFEEQGDEVAEGVEQEADYDEVDNEEDDGAAAHLGDLSVRRLDRGRSCKEKVGS
jgi:hypothetical protein